MAEPSQHTSRLFLLDRKSGQKFLIDSGSEICVIPPSPTMNKSPQSNFSLFAANNTKIPAYAECDIPKTAVTTPWGLYEYPWGLTCKPAFFLNTEDLQLPQTKNETPATVESDPTASTPTQPSKLSGRKVHLPTRYR
ncbi:hypothetical protein TNCV_3480041 [Trichonephila clavipes]|nr:hypothetical protein TNCV_3480041 [Trichonephila clavipes]